MFEKLEKLEEMLNSRITAIQAFLVKLYFILMPKFALSFLRRLSLWTKKQNTILKSRTKTILQQLNELVSKTREKISNAINSILAYPCKEVLFGFLEKAKILLLKTPLKSHAVLLVESLKKKINHVDKVTDQVGKGQLAFGVVALTVIGFGFFSVINKTNQILLSEYPERSPASVQEYKYKPEYKDFAKRTVKVLNMKIPIYRDSVKGIRSVTVDFTVRTNTRFAKQYLEHYENQLRDYFFTNVEPVISSFPIEEEGKLVFKEKITDDLNAFLKEKNVEGSVEEVGLSFIVAH